MKWRMGLIIGLVFTLALAAPVAAEFYKYVDEDGNTRFTDDITQIPEDQRAKLQEYAEIEYTEPKTASANEVDQESEAYNRAKIKEQLDAQGNELDAEFQFIERTKIELKERKGQLSSNEEIQAYNYEVEQLQQMSAEHKQRVETYNQEVADFNDQVQAQEDP